VFLPPEGLQNLEPEANLYGGFVPDADRRLLQQLRLWSPERLAQQAHEGRLQFADPRLEALVWHYRARHHSAHLSADEQRAWLRERSQRLHQSGRVTIAAYLERLDELQAENEDPARQAVLEGLVDWVEAMAPPHPDELGFGRA
jgi:exodeoxyribonuclease I